MAEAYQVIDEAANIVVDASGFSGNLGPSDTDVQTALGTIDQMTGGVTDIGGLSASGYVAGQEPRWNGSVFSGSMPGAGLYTRTVIVDQGGLGDFTTIKAACDYVATKTRNLSNRWEIRVNIGNYAELPFVVPTHTVITGGRYPNWQSAPGVRISISGTLTSGPFITAGTPSGITNTEILVGSATGTMIADVDLIFCSGGNFFADNLFINTANTNSTAFRLNFFRGIGFFTNCTFFTHSGANNTTMLNFTGASNARYCILFSGANTGSIGVHNQAGVSNLAYCRFGGTAVDYFNPDIKVDAGDVYLNNSPIQSYSGSIIWVERLRTNVTNVHQATLATTIPIIARGASAQTANLLEMQDVNSTIRFAVEPDGDIRTSQSASATTPGSVTAKLPIYDAAGTLIGYIPIYDAIT